MPTRIHRLPKSANIHIYNTHTQATPHAASSRSFLCNHLLRRPLPAQHRLVKACWSRLTAHPGLIVRWRRLVCGWMMLRAPPAAVSVCMYIYAYYAYIYLYIHAHMHTWLHTNDIHVHTSLWLWYTRTHIVVVTTQTCLKGNESEGYYTHTYILIYSHIYQQSVQSLRRRVEQWREGSWVLRHH